VPLMNNFRFRSVVYLMVVVWLRKCRDLSPPWNRGEAAFLLVHGQIHYRDQLLARLTGFLPTMFDERNHYSRIVWVVRLAVNSISINRQDIHPALIFLHNGELC